MTAKKTFLGFGLGAVQSGLMLFEALKSGNFDRFIIVEINESLVKAVRKAGNAISINTATESGIIKSSIPGIEILNPSDPKDLPTIKEAIYTADEMATAIPSVEFYDAGGKQSIAYLLTRNLNPEKKQILYAAENNNYAAEILLDKIVKHRGAELTESFQAVNTVIGKMGGVIDDMNTIHQLKLDLITPGNPKAILVEEFNNIIISKIHFNDYKRGIEVFQEKDDLLPFEEAKLYGHNAVHSMLGFFAQMRGYKFMSQIRQDRQLYEFGEKAFQDECGAFLLKKYQRLDEPLFTKAGFDFYGSDLLKRMTNPFLRDEVARICRAPLRKLLYHDRFLGTIREALAQNITARLIAQAVIAGIYYVIMQQMDIGIILPSRISNLTLATLKSTLTKLWENEEDDGYKKDALDLICSQYDIFKKTFLS